MQVMDPIRWHPDPLRHSLLLLPTLSRLPYWITYLLIWIFIIFRSGALAAIPLCISPMMLIAEGTQPKMVTKRLDMPQCLEKTTVMEERQRLARDLHDGLLQSLTGMALQLETTQSLLVDQATDAARERLQVVQTMLCAEQRRLRGYIERLKKPREIPDAAARWDVRLIELERKIEQEWGLPVTVSIKGAIFNLSTPLAEELYLLVCEALTNSARHASATQALTEIAMEANHIRIQVQDNGRGFAFRGRYDLAELIQLGQGPQSLMGRIAALHGQLIVESSQVGSRLNMIVPRER